MNIAIFNHPVNDFYFSPARVNPGILEYLNNIIKPHNGIFFDVIKKKRTSIPLPDDLEYLSDYLVPDITEYAFFNTYYRFGDVNNFNHKYLKDFNPDLFIVTSFAYCYFNSLSDMISYLKKLYPDKLIIVGGPGPSANPVFYLENSFCDYVVKGPAEYSLKKLVDAISQKETIKIPNVYHAADTNPILDLESDYSFSPHISKKKKSLQLQITRGCPKKCSYCSVKLTAGSGFYMSDIDSVLKGLRKLQLTEDQKIHMNFEDDNVLVDTKGFFKILTNIKKMYPHATFSAENGIDFLLLGNDIIDKLIDTGFTQFNLSLTSIHKSILQKTGRHYLPNEIDAVLHKLEDKSIPAIVYFICGLMNDSVDGVLDTICFLASRWAVLGISNFYPVPGTDIVDHITSELKPVITKGSSFYPWFNLTTSQLVTFFIITRFTNAIKKIGKNTWLDSSGFEITDDNRIIGDKKDLVDRRKLTVFMIQYAICHSVFPAVLVKDEKVYIEPYKTDKDLTEKFFSRIKKGELIIKTSSKDILDNTFWSDVCRNLYR